MQITWEGNLRGTWKRKTVRLTTRTLLQIICVKCSLSNYKDNVVVFVLSWRKDKRVVERQTMLQCVISTFFQTKLFKYLRIVSHKVSAYPRLHMQFQKLIGAHYLMIMLRLPFHSSWAFTSHFVACNSFLHADIIYVISDVTSGLGSLALPASGLCIEK